VFAVTAGCSDGSPPQPTAPEEDDAVTGEGQTQGQTVAENQDVFLRSACGGAPLVAGDQGQPVAIAAPGQETRFRFERLATGRYKVAAAGSNRVFDVGGAASEKAAKVIAWEWHGGANQQWMVDTLPSGEVRLRPSHAAGLLLDLAWADTKAGSAVHLWPDNGSCAQRWRVVPASSTSTAPGHKPDGGAAAPRKSAALGMGLSGVTDYSGQVPFIDLAKQARWWGPQGNAFDYDAEGWVRRLPPGEPPVLVFLSDVPSPWTRFVVRWKGDGALEPTWGMSLVSSGDHEMVISGKTGALKLRATNPSDPVRDIRILPEPFVTAYDKGEVFNPLWVDRIREFRALRFMDWMRTNNSAQSAWADRPKVNDASWAPKGVPVEVMVRLANETNSDPWFNMPHLATDEYVREFARYVKANLKPHLVAYVEYSNEVWNFQFQQSQYAIQQAKTAFGDVGSGWVQYNAMRAAKTCDVWKKEVFGAEAARVHCVIGAFTGWRDLIRDTLDCPAWAAKGHGACSTHGIDSVAITGYFGGCLAPRSDAEIATIRQWFGDPDKGITRGLEQALDGRHLELEKGGRCGDTVEGNLATYQFFKRHADERGLALTAYEGGQHITGNASKIQDDPAFVGFHIGLNRAPGMKGLYQKNFAHWKAAGGTLFMHFVDITVPSKWGSWGALESLSQPTSPKWEAIREANAQTCWWKGC
jgi:hypothetical protein